ncbi:hypothetical protein DWZ21_25105 [Hungatella hathewayi]|nr:hypothetical protein DWZ21_25105 [Hungatella hathewayi]
MGVGAAGLWNHIGTDNSRKTQVRSSMRFPVVLLMGMLWQKSSLRRCRRAPPIYLLSNHEKIIYNVKMACEEPHEAGRDGFAQGNFS